MQRVANIFRKLCPLAMKCQVHESRLISINEDERKSTRAGISEVNQINRGQFFRKCSIGGIGGYLCDGVNIVGWPYLGCRFVGDQQGSRATTYEDQSSRIGVSSLAASTRSLRLGFGMCRS
jgi:hypothetical protein